jgi:hypothetical protein
MHTKLYILCKSILVYTLAWLNWSNYPEMKDVTTLALELRPRQGLVKVRAKSETWEPHFMLLGGWEYESVWELNLHTLKWTPILGVGVLMDSQIFRMWLQGSEPIGLKHSLYHWKDLGTWMSKMGSHDSFGHLKHKLWPKEGLGVKLTMWFSTIKSQESPQFPCVQVACDILLESSQLRLQLCFRPHFNRRSTHKVMRAQSCKSPNFGNFGTFIWES